MSSVRGEKPKKPKVVYWFTAHCSFSNYWQTDRPCSAGLGVCVCLCCTARNNTKMCQFTAMHLLHSTESKRSTHLLHLGFLSLFPSSASWHLLMLMLFSFLFFFCFGALCSQFAFKKCVPANWANKNKLVCLHWRKHTHKWAIARIQINDVGMRRTLDSFTCDASEEGSKMRAKSVGKCLAVQDTVFPQRHPFDYHTSSTLNTQFKRPFLNWLDFLRFYSFDHHRHQ